MHYKTLGIGKGIFSFTERSRDRQHPCVPKLTCESVQKSLASFLLLLHLYDFLCLKIPRSFCGYETNFEEIFNTGLGWYHCSLPLFCQTPFLLTEFLCSLFVFFSWDAPCWLLRCDHVLFHNLKSKTQDSVVSGWPIVCEELFRFWSWCSCFPQCACIQVRIAVSGNSLSSLSLEGENGFLYSTDNVKVKWGDFF